MGSSFGISLRPAGLPMWNTIDFDVKIILSDLALGTSVDSTHFLSER